MKAMMKTIRTGNSGIAAARRGVLFGLALGVGLGVAAPGVVRTVVAGGPARAQAPFPPPAPAQYRQDTAGLVVPFGSGEPGRYALTVPPAVLSPNGGTVASEVLYLLDTQSGRVWRLDWVRESRWKEVAPPPLPQSVTLPSK